MKNFVSITLSDSRAEDPSIKDKSGDIIVETLTSYNLKLYDRVLIPDEPSEIKLALEKYIYINQVNLIVTTGGTGISQRDITPEITSEFLEKNIPGIPELIRNSSYEKIKTSILYRGLCGIANNKIILNLPGSPGGVKDGLRSIVEVLPHMFDLIEGKQGH